MILACLLLASCEKSSEKAAREYQLLARSGATSDELCEKAKEIAGAYLAEEDEPGLRRAILRSKSECHHAHQDKFAAGDRGSAAKVSSHTLSQTSVAAKADPAQAVPRRSLRAGSQGQSCSGFYAYIPADRNQEVPFSVQVQSNGVEILWLDYSPAVFARKQQQRDGSLVFYASDGGASTMHCKSSSAIVHFAADLQTPRRTYQLNRSKTDNWGIARQRGWPKGD